jgi:mannose-6-phosphate isomerase-like protein (cupin superfamily)
VSGASSAAQDDEIATASAAEFEKQQNASVTITPKAKVDAAFQRDATLVSTDSYRVNASKRDHAGEAEVHSGDTDVFYVLEGSATVVTGGDVVDAHAISPGETRGSRIDSGEERRINKGDVVTIPSGTPHWFKSVDTPFKYYVVKVK